MDRISTTVREQVALGRLLPLGAAGDPLWITESAVAHVLRRAASLPGTRLGSVRILLDDAAPPDESALADAPDAADGGTPPVGDTSADGTRSHRIWPGDGDASGEPGARVADAAPLGALAHGPLRIEADFEAAMDEPLTVVAERLRDALWTEARDAFGVTVAAVDLRITGILEGFDGEPAGTDGTVDAAGTSAVTAVDGAPVAGLPSGPAFPGGPAAAVADAVRAVPGVHAITARLASAGTGVRVTEPQARPGRRRVQVQIAVAAGHRPLTVARAAAEAATAAAAAGSPDPVSAAVVVTDVY